MKTIKYILIFLAGFLAYFVIGGVCLYLTGNTPAEFIALFLESIFG